MKPVIITASRRTDIPSFYSDWFFNRLKAKYLYVLNPFNPNQVRRLSLAPEDVDGIVFCTKNPLPMMDRLELLGAYAFYFQFTITAYGTDAEAGIPSKNDVIVPTFIRLADRLGPERVIWRYDPIFFSAKYTAELHAEFYERIAARLKGYTKKCIISFLDRYRHIDGRLKKHGFKEPDNDEIISLVQNLSASARRYGLELETCAESVDLSAFGIGHARCVDAALLEKLRGRRISAAKDRNQRPDCGCAESVDIGAYNTCRNGCVYCYANRSIAAVGMTAGKYDPLSPILCGKIGENDINKNPAKTNITGQLSIFGNV